MIGTVMAELNVMAITVDITSPKIEMVVFTIKENNGI